jgi:hypothetical protein
MHYQGPVIGDFMGRPIFKSLEQSGTAYEFDRLANCDADGCFIQDLKNSELFVKPGLIYRRKG